LDEYRYHESLIHVPIALHNRPVKNVLLLGAGDGLAIRELLKYPEIENITLIDLDKTIIDLARENRYLSRLNEQSLNSSKLSIIIDDAFTYLKDSKQVFDFIICDLPDPNNTVLSRLYSKQFYKLLKKRLKYNGVLVTQATSPYFATKAFWSIKKTISASGFSTVLPYHTEIPSFGDWGFVVASKSGMKLISDIEINVPTKFIDQNNYAKLFIFDKDIMVDEHELEINMLDKPALLQYYLDGWSRYSY